MKLFKKRKYNYDEVEPDEIFLDSKNLPKFDKQQFEGRIEKPISKKAIFFLGLFFVLVGLIFVFRLWNLQIIKGEFYFFLSQNNSLERLPIFSDRGIIYDRNNIELAWNSSLEEVKEMPFPYRSYINSGGFSHLLGYVSYPTVDKSGFYWQEELIGKSGIEKEYNSILSGKNGLKILETDVFGEIQFENIINPPKLGENIILSIDSLVQKEFFKIISNFSKEYSFTGGAGILMDVNKGEILALTSFPEYNSEILSLGEDEEQISKYLNDINKPFLIRPIGGLYAPGSIVKPFLAIGALQEGIIIPEKKILSTGSISIPNRYFPDQESIFKDWKAHGWVNMKEALAVSSNVYFYNIGGGYENQQGLGINNIEKYIRLFGIGEKTGINLIGEVDGIIPNPLWKEINFNGDRWRIGDTYHTAIGQYGFQVTPLQMVRAISTIANNGYLLKPTLLFNNDALMVNESKKIEISEKNFDTVKEGMRLAVTSGTASSLNIPAVKVSAKTGTAQLGFSSNGNKKINSWVIGFFPYEKPKYAFTVLLENGPEYNSTSASHVMRDLLNWMSINTPKYLE